MQHEFHCTHLFEHYVRDIRVWCVTADVFEDERGFSIISGFGGAAARLLSQMDVHEQQHGVGIQFHNCNYIHVSVFDLIIRV